MTTSNKKKFEVTFWGTRGTLPVSGSPFVRTGGNTNCTEITCGEHTIIIDAGTGIRELGSKLVTTDPDRKIHLLLTHAHYDHVEGIPFFAPFFTENSTVDITCGKLDGAKSIKETLSRLMKRPFFPVGPEVFTANIEYQDLKDNETFAISDEIKVSTVPLNHPGGATGYRIDYNQRSFACITDTEHEPGKPDEAILKLIDGVDIFSYDSSLTDEELPDFKGYGHSTFEEGMRLCKLANAGAMRAFHHMPFRSDDELDLIEKKIKAENPKSGVAREGVTEKI